MDVTAPARQRLPTEVAAGANGRPTGYLPSAGYTASVSAPQNTHDDPLRADGHGVRRRDVSGPAFRALTVDGRPGADAHLFRPAPEGLRPADLLEAGGGAP